MKIYTNGDSFTSGQELVDFLLPGYPGNHNIKFYLAKDANLTWADQRTKLILNYFGSLENLIEQEKLAAWPNCLRKINENLTVYNGSRYGSSITGICNRTLADLLELKNNNLDFIFIQLTNTPRIEFYNSNLPERYFLQERSLAWIHQLKDNSLEKQIATAFMKYNSDADYSIKYLYCLCGIKNIVKSLTGINPIFLLSTPFIIGQILDPIRKNPDLENNKIIKNLIIESGILDLKNDDSMEYVHELHKFQYTPMGHYEKRTHEKFAEHIYNRYINL
jgi:hypothetical protein